MSVTRTNGGALPIGATGQTLVTGRSLQMFTIGLTSVETGYSAVNSDFEKLVRAIETVGSIEILGIPAANAFRVAVSGTEITASSGTGSLQSICNAAVATTTVADFAF
jgi:hypothetical protein